MEPVLNEGGILLAALEVSESEVELGPLGCYHLGQSMQLLVLLHTSSIHKEKYCLPKFWDLASQSVSVNENIPDV